MSGLEQKLYQLIISRLDGENISSPAYAENALELVEKGIGGFIIFGGEKSKIRAFINKLQSIAQTPLFISSDIERGVAQQIEGATHFPGQMALTAATDIHNPESVKALKGAINAIALESIDTGINMPLIPVLDVNRNPDNPIICTRAFSDDPEIVAMYGKMYIRILEEYGLISCAKHFPGHGDTAVDSHISLPVISKSLDELMKTDISPFREAIAADVSSIMIGHLTVPAIDDLPASLSHKLITGLLRTELGYEGLILTDALNMHALNEFKNVPSMCIEAGVDIILHPADPDVVVEELKHAISSGEIKEKKIDTAFERILRYKSRLKKIQKPEVDYNDHTALASGLSDKAITILKDTPGLLPLTNIQEASLFYTRDENRHDISAIHNFIPGSINLKDFKGDVTSDTAIFTLFTSIAAWAGSSGIRNEELTIIQDLIKNSRNSIVISFGSPYVLRNFMEADVLIAAYDASGQAQKSVIKCLKGETDFMGRLPVTL
jgi:beta-glucosidase-like glycosyl hydrolase